MFLGNLTNPPAVRGTWPIEVWVRCKLAAAGGKLADLGGKQRWKVDTGEEVQTGRESCWRPISWI